VEPATNDSPPGAEAGQAAGEEDLGRRQPDDVKVNRAITTQLLLDKGDQKTEIELLPNVAGRLRRDVSRDWSSSLSLFLPRTGCRCR
jgi:hypothetical protein